MTRIGRILALLVMASSVAYGQSEVGSFPNAAPLTGSERILADQSGTTVNILPSQIVTYLGIPNGILYGNNSVLTAATGAQILEALGLPSIVANDCIAGNSDGSALVFTACGSGSMTWPSAAGIAVYGGSSAWTTSISTLVGLDSLLGVTLPSVTGTPTTGHLAYWQTGGSSPVLGDLNFTGSGNAVLATSPTLVTPNLGTPSAINLVNGTGLPIAGISATGTPSSTTYLRGDGSWSTVSGGSLPSCSTNQLIYYAATGTTGSCLTLGTNLSISSGTLNSAGGGGMTYPGAGIPVSTGSAWSTSITPGTGVAAALAVNVGSAGAVVTNGGALGTPSSGTLTNATGLPISTGVSGLATGMATFLGTPSSANLAATVTNETGTGSLVFATSPTLVTPALGTPSALVCTNCTGTASGLNIGGTAANLSGTPALPNGTTATTQTTGDNSTKLATDAFVIANASSSGVSSAAAGSGIVISGTGSGPYTGAITIGTTVPNRTVTSTTDTISCTTDAGGVVIYDSSSAVAVTVPQATGSCGNGFGVTIINIGAGTVTLTPTTSTINGLTSITAAQYTGGSIVSNGTNYVAANCTACVSGGGSTAFSSLTSGENNSATMTVGPSAVFGILGSSGTGYTALASANTSSTNYTATLPANSGTVAETNFAQTFTAKQSYNAPIYSNMNGAASNSQIQIVGSLYTGGTGTTTFPMLFADPGATAVTTWSTAGTFFGINAASGFTGNFADYHVNGGSSAYSVNYQGNVIGGTYNGSTIPTSAGTLPGSTGGFTIGDCLEVGSTSPLEIEDNGSACGTGGSTAFSAITGSTNTSAAMVVGSGASLSASGTGTIAATTATQLAASWLNAASAGTSITPICATGQRVTTTTVTATGNLTINAPTGCAEGQGVVLKITYTASITYTWNASYHANASNPGAIPTASGGSSGVDFFSFYDDAANSRFDYLAGAFAY